MIFNVHFKYVNSFLQYPPYSHIANDFLHVYNFQTLNTLHLQCKSSDKYFINAPTYWNNQEQFDKLNACHFSDAEN